MGSIRGGYDYYSTTTTTLLLLLLVRGEFSIHPYICQFIFYLSIQQGIHITTYDIPAGVHLCATAG